MNFKGEDDRDEAAMAMQRHDLSLAGVANRSDHWFVFPGHEHLIPGSTRLPFGNTYRDLIGGLANLPGLPLGHARCMRAVAALAAYDPATATAGDEQVLKRGLVVPTVMVNEALRLRPVREAVGKGWESGEARVAGEPLPYIEHWDTICFEIIRAHHNGVWDGPFTGLLREHAGIHGVDEALDVVNVLINRTMTDLVSPD